MPPGARQHLTAAGRRPGGPLPQPSAVAASLTAGAEQGAAANPGQGNGPYVYRNVGGLYVGQGQSMARLAYLLYRRGRSFPFEDRLAARGWEWLSPRLLRLPRVMRYAWLARSVLHDPQPTGAGDAILSPHRGQVALKKKSGGYCVFDLERQTATWALGGAVAADEFARRVTIQQAMSARGIAPRVRQVAGEQLVFVEEYVNARRLPPVSASADTFRNAARPIILTLLGMPAVPVSVGEYAATLGGQIAAIAGPRLLPGWGELEGLVSRCRDVLVTAAQETVRRHPSHGDLSERNMFILHGKPLAIDWETFEERTVLYDAFTHFLSSMCRSGGVLAEPARMFPLMHGSVLAMTGDLNDAGLGRRDADRDWYPSLFLMELISSKLRQLVQPVLDDARRLESRMRLVRRYVETFNEYLSWRTTA